MSSAKWRPVYLGLNVLTLSLRSAAYMRQYPGSALVKAIAYSLFGAKSLAELVLNYCRLDP